MKNILLTVASTAIGFVLLVNLLFLGHEEELKKSRRCLEDRERCECEISIWSKHKYELSYLEVKTAIRLIFSNDLPFGIIFKHLPEYREIERKVLAKASDVCD